MPLPTPNLDDRRFQDIVDEAKSLIPLYCPEWTDHNVSDPGVALIELFAWMTDLLLYRVNQVPDKVYLKFLELIGVRLQPPRAAQAPVTFYLSAAQPTDVTISEGTEVATIQTETNPAIVFTTETDLTIRPVTLLGAFTADADGSGSAASITHDLRQLDLPNQRIALFPVNPAPGDAFDLALEKDHSYHVLVLTLACQLAGGAGVDPNNPPIEWQVWQGSQWVRCGLEHDGTGGFSWSGDITLHTPAMAEAEFHGRRAHWLRCRLTEAQAARPGGYEVSPRLERLRVESRGGTTRARHATTVLNEVLGQSAGTPGQTFRLLHTPVLTRDPARDHLIVDGDPEPWEERDDFADSGPQDRHFTLDSLDGTVTLGPSLLQPDGSVYLFGAVPPRGSVLRFSRYQYGGGVAGNMPEGALCMLKTSIPYVRQVTNREAAVGGQDAQSLEDAKLRAPQMLRRRIRAVTAGDYEYLACQVPGVARACCLAPGAQSGNSDKPQPGHVVVIVLPQVDEPHGPIPPEQLTLSANLRAKVLDFLNARRPLGGALDVRQPRYIQVSVEATLRLLEPTRFRPSREVEQQAEAALYCYLNPYVGGPDGRGWPFGRELHPSEIYGLLQRIPSVAFVEDVRISTNEPGGSGELRPVPSTLVVSRDAVICSGKHLVRSPRVASV